MVWCVPVSDWAMGIQVGQCPGYRRQEDGLLIFIPHSDYENRHHRVSNLSHAGCYPWCCGALACRCRKSRAALVKTVAQSQHWTIAATGLAVAAVAALQKLL